VVVETIAALEVVLVVVGTINVLELVLVGVFFDDSATFVLVDGKDAYTVYPWLTTEVALEQEVTVAEALRAPVTVTVIVRGDLGSMVLPFWSTQTVATSL
jgi:hypothetical protein